MTIRTTTPVERVDMMLSQAEEFAARGLDGEAIARARQAIAHCEREEALNAGEALRAELEQRKTVAESIVLRFGRSLRDSAGHLCVSASDAVRPRSWSE